MITFNAFKTALNAISLRLDALKKSFDGISKRLSSTEAAIPAPDWDESDPESNNYIRNRPFYEAKEYATFEFHTESDGSYTFQSDDERELYRTMAETSAKADVYIGDNIYKATGSFSTGHYMFIRDEDQATLIDNYIGYNPNKVFATSFPDSDIKIVTEITTDLKKLDLKFIPDEVYTDSNAPILRGSGTSSVVQGLLTTASGDMSHAEGERTTASGNRSHAEGYYTTASGRYSHAEGYDTKASGDYSHAEGRYTKASGYYSHAEGYSTTASGEGSHAEGRGAEGHTTTASGDYSHAEGYNTTASGSYAHAEGYNTTASSSYQHVQGKYNIEDTAGKYAHIVGNGTLNTARSNAYTLDWEGNAWFAGTIKGTKLILRSETSGSTKRFEITVDDSGTISAKEITS